MRKVQSIESDETTFRRGDRRRALFLGFGLFVIVVCVYLPSARYGYLFDESVILFRTVPPQSLTELVEKSWAPHFPGLEYFRPVPHATYLAQYMWDRNDPGAFHIFNALAMGLTACVSFAFLRLPCFRIRPVLAAIAAALFAVHPASSSCVTPIVGRETMFAGCLTVGAVYAFFRGGQAWYFIALFLFALALLSKEQTIVIPVLFVFGDLLGLSQDAPGRSPRSWIRRYVPILLVALVYLVIRWNLFSGTEYQFQLFDHPFGPLTSVGYALQTIFTPFVELAYEPALEVWLSPTRLITSSLLFCGLATLFVRSDAELRRIGVFWLGWFLVTIAPTSNVIEQQAPYSERYVLLATLAVVAAVASLASVRAKTSRVQSIIVVIGLGLVSASAITTVHRGKCFENPLTFSEQWAKTSPQFGEAQMSLGIELHLRGRTEEAAECFAAGIEFDPVSRNLSREWLGKMRLLQGQYSQAEQQFRILTNEQAGSARNDNHSGLSLLGLGKLDEAIERFEQAVSRDPQFGGAHFLLAASLDLKGDTTRAQQHRSIAAALPFINVSFAQIGDSQLQELSRFPNLRHLVLESTAITDEGMISLRDATNLTRLWIPGTRISDKGISHLQNLPNLSSLVLTNTHLTDRGIEHLLQLNRLKHLDIRNTRVTLSGLRKLKSGLTDCLIVY